ncbi:MAG: hypothetical protein PHI98_06620 [Eubacteriales bacterium]|nr:hypothetical protein [Eubacteriales bacterium]
MVVFASREKNRWLTALVAVLLLLAATYLISDVVFQTNDDNNIVAAASGGVTGEPYAGNGLTGYVYGAALAGFYRLWGGLPWHAMLMTAIQALALIALLRSVLFLCNQQGIYPLWGLLAFAALYLGVGVKFMVRLQFTAAPGYCGAALAALLWTLPESKRGKLLCCVIGMSLLTFALLLRLQGGLLVLPVPLLMGLAKWLKRDHASRAALLACLCALGLTTAVLATDGILYRTNEPGWDEHAEFAELSGVLLDYHNDDETYRLAEKVTDWSPELISCVRNWDLFIDSRFNSENLGALAEAVEENTSPPSLGEVMKKTGSVLKRYPEFAWNGLAFAILGLWALASFIRNHRWIEGTLLTLCALSMAAVIAFFYGFQNRFPDRVAFAYAWPVYSAALLLIIDAFPTPMPGERLPANRRAAIGAALLLTAALATVLPHWDDTLVLRSGNPTREGRAALSAQVDAYAASHPEWVYVTDVTQAFYAFSTERSPVNRLEWGSPMLRSPMYGVKLQRLGFPDGFTTETLQNQKVRLLLANSSSIERLMACIHADIGPWEAELIEDAGAFCVWQIHGLSS